MKHLIAQVPHPIGTIGEGEGFGPWADASKAIENFTTIMSHILGVMTICAGIWFMFQFIIGAYNWLSAGGEKASLQNAQKRLTNAVIGLALVVAAYALIDIIGDILGFKLLRPGDLIKLVSPPK